LVIAILFFSEESVAEPVDFWVPSLMLASIIVTVHLGKIQSFLWFQNIFTKVPHPQPEPPKSLDIYCASHMIYLSWTGAVSGPKFRLHL
jgi:hypothetical protein